IDKAMARNRDDRYRSAAEFQRDLQTLRDRYVPAQQSLAADLVRAADALRTPPPPAPLAEPGLDPKPPPRPREPTPSSVEIPITFSNDTPLSGENLPVDPTHFEAHPHPVHPTPSDASEFEEYPTQVHVSPFDEPRAEDAQTTQRRGPEFSRQLAHASRGVRDTEVSARPGVGDTDATGKPAALRSARKARPDVSDDQETIIKSRSAFPLPKRKATRKVAASPDDTIKVDSDVSPGEGDPTQLMALRAPKAPRR
ncbi:MAG: hypothetical protein ACRELB_09975, partial [Polyangiaceae bacterium]